MIKHSDYQHLSEVFAGRRVRITHKGNKRLPTFMGVFERFEHRDTRVDVILKGHHKYSLVPENVSSTALEGPIQGHNLGRRKIELVVPRAKRTPDDQSPSTSAHS